MTVDFVSPDCCIRPAFQWRRNLALTKPLLVLSVALLLGTAWAQPRADDLSTSLAAAQKAVRLQDFAQAADHYRRAAEAGNSEAQYQLGTLYLLGRGVAKNEDRAREFFQQAAGQNHPAAQFGLAQLMRDQAPERAAQLTQSAAELGYAPALAYISRGTPAPRINQDAPVEAQWFGAARANQSTLLQTLLAQ